MGDLLVVLIWRYVPTREGRCVKYVCVLLCSVGLLCLVRVKEWFGRGRGAELTLHGKGDVDWRVVSVARS